MYKLADPAWWRSIANGLVRTLIAAAAPFVSIVAANPTDRAVWLKVALVVGLAVVGSIATALSKLPDPAGLWWEIALQRAARQFGQMVAAALVGAVVLTDVDWSSILILAGWSAVTTFVLAALSLGIDPADLDLTDAQVSNAVAAIANPASPDSGGTDDLDADLDGTPAGSDVGADGEVDESAEAPATA